MTMKNAYVIGRLDKRKAGWVLTEIFLSPNSAQGLGGLTSESKTMYIELCPPRMAKLYSDARVAVAANFAPRCGPFLHEGGPRVDAELVDAWRSWQSNFKKAVSESLREEK
jgi:hypothetical protein